MRLYVDHNAADEQKWILDNLAALLDEWHAQGREEIAVKPERNLEFYEFAAEQYAAAIEQRGDDHVTVQEG